MIWNRQDNLSIVELGAINGIVFGSLLELSFRAIYLYETYSLDKVPFAEVTICRTSYPFSWWFLPVFSFVVVTTASYLVNRYLSQRIKSSLWLWQIIGFVFVFGACLYSVARVLYYWYFGESDLLAVDFLIEYLLGESGFVLPLIPIVICFNLIFVLVLRVWKTRLL